MRIETVAACRTSTIYIECGLESSLIATYLPQNKVIYSYRLNI